MIESLLMTVTRVSTYLGTTALTNATGFFFRRDERLFLITSRHVVLDQAHNHRPDRLTVEFHVDGNNLAQVIQWSLPLYSYAQPIWREAADAASTVDIVVVEIDRAALPDAVLLSAFSAAHLVTEFDSLEVGNPVLIVGFPLGFHDTLHHLPVARQAAVASAFGIRFQGQGYFLTDARMHRGTSGAPVVARMSAERSGRGELPWLLLGVHSSRLDVSDRDLAQDERLDLNCAWYADVLLALTR